MDRPRKRLLPPEPNPFLPTDFSIVDSKDTSRVPQPIIKDQLATLWHVNGGFETPHAQVRIFISNRHSVISPRMYVGLDMMDAVINSKLRTLEQQAREAGMSLSVEAQYAGISIQASGFSQHMEQLLVSLACLFSLEHVSQANFDAAKEWLANEISSSQSAVISKLLHEEAKYALISKVFSNKERSEQLDVITLNDTKDLSRLFFRQVHVDALVIGNLSPEASASLFSNVMKQLGASPSTLPKIEPRPNIEITPPGSFVYETTMAKGSGVAATLVYLDMYDYPNVTLRAHTELLSKLLPMPFLNYFRNEEALSISPKVSIRRLTSRGGLQFTVESTHDPAYIEQHINLFLFKFEVNLPNVPNPKEIHCWHAKHQVPEGAGCIEHQQVHSPHQHGHVGKQALVQHTLRLLRLSRR
ncbi:hypothetical protein DSO57_1019199 [Entomophthora muscae]|uniref:Uncharacterized protein n=1 Tax=Entomophthora muscae TaxID=34485 RepID=A0ACC2T4I8_9FUNG|nr:hypothetical protein DSO57_1019199 [Entomophthora muscae]